jgi:hypothetical protein
VLGICSARTTPSSLALQHLDLEVDQARTGGHSKWVCGDPNTVEDHRFEWGFGDNGQLHAWDIELAAEANGEWDSKVARSRGNKDTAALKQVADGPGELRGKSGAGDSPRCWCDPPRGSQTSARGGPSLYNRRFPARPRGPAWFEREPGPQPRHSASQNRSARTTAR